MRSSTLSDTLTDGHQRPSLANSTPATASIPKSSQMPHTSADVPENTSAFPAKEGLSLLSPQTANDGCEEGLDLDVVAIHGLNGHPRDTWTYQTPEKVTYWLYDFLPKALPGARIFTYGYDSKPYLSPSTADLRSYAKGLLDHLSILRDEPLHRIRSLVFICHSLGGLVCKEAIVIANEKRDRYGSILESTKGMFFFGTPHKGSKLAETALNMAQIFRIFDWGMFEFVFGSKFVRRDILEELCPNSKALDRLYSAFTERATKIPCIVTFRELHRFRSHLVVSKESATIGATGEDVVDLAGDHREICRIKSEKDLAFQRIVRECRKINRDLSARTTPLSSKEQSCVDSLIDSLPPDLINVESAAVKSTCEWVLSTKQFRSWRDGPTPLLWVTGEFGCGKTTLLSFLKERLSTRDGKGDPLRVGIVDRLIVSKFFFNDKYKECTNATVLLRCLIWDLINQCPDMLCHVFKHYQAFRPWSYVRLWNCFQAILDDRNAKGTCFIIDALDQCHDKDTRKFVEDLATFIETRPQQGNRSIKFILSSRPILPGPVDRLEKAALKLSFDHDKVLQSHVTTDVRYYVIDHLLHDGRVFPWNDPKREEKIRMLADDVATRAEGCFLWAVLVLEELHKRSFIKLSDIKDFLTECPQDIKGIYTEALKNVKMSYYEIVFKSFNIILAASRPLTILEFMAALAIENQHRTLKSLGESVEEQEHMKSYLEQILGPLLRIDKSMISFRHQSAKDFLLNHLPISNGSGQISHHQRSSDSCAHFFFSENEAQDTLRACCTDFLKLEDFNADIGPENDNLELLETAGFGAMDPFPSNSQWYEDDCAVSESCPAFFEYAALNWPFHFAASGNASDRSLDAALGLLTDVNVLKHWSHQFRRNYQGYPNMPESLDASIVAAYLGLLPVILRLMSNTDLNLDWDTALTWASRAGHLAIVEKLVEFGVPPRGHFVDGRNALSWAVAGGYLKIVDVLLTRNVDLINVEDADECCPLILAVVKHDQAMVERLMGLENINVNLRSKQGTSAISLAIERPDPTTAELQIFLRLLNDPRVSITLKDNDGRTCLSYLAQNGATPAIQALLDSPDRQEAVHQLLQDAGDKRGLSPLSYAAWWGDYTSTIRLLCETHRIQRQLESKDARDGENVFHKAARYDHANAIRELAKHYPHGLNARDTTGRTPLSTAMWGNSVDVVQALLDCGADPNVPDDSGCVALSHGIAKMEMVRALAAHGANLNYRDNAGHTPLWWAKGRVTDERAMQELRDLGAHL